MASNKKILIVDDSKELRDALSDYLQRSGFEIKAVADGEEMYQWLSYQQPDLIILDIMLPGDDGFTLCREIRKSSNVPIIMLTAVTDEIDRVAGLELGADDYITKTFNPRELLARIKALFRRYDIINNITPSRYIRLSHWKLDTHTHTLQHENGNELHLSSADYRLLDLFINNPNTPLSRNDISKKIYNRETLPLDRSIDIQVSRLRQKLNDKDHRLIKTLRSEGYMLNISR